MISKRQKSIIRASGVIEGIKSEVLSFSESLDSTMLWLPSVGLKKQCGEVSRLIDELRERLDRKLLVTIIGPCGSGKSTLLNALAGVDELSETGNERPTTKKPVVLSKDPADANQLVFQLGPGNAEIRHSADAEYLEHVLLIDTPDMDSTSQEKHVPIVQQAIDLSDVLICVFNSENPKKRDYADFLAPYVQRFKGESLVCVMNKCDRQDETELRSVIVPEFLQYIRDAWEKPIDTVLCVCARRNLRDPKWDEKATPRNDFDEFGILRSMVFGMFNQASFVIDRRLENAESLREHIRAEIGAEFEKDRETLLAAAKQIAETEKEAVRDAVEELKTANMRQLVGVNVLLYQKLAQRWVGPVGWLIAIWGRILVLGAGVAAVFRFGNPVSQIYGVVSSLRRYKESREAIREIGSGERVDSALRGYRVAIMRNWPEIAESLVNGRFDMSVRKTDGIMPDNDVLSEDVSSVWNESLDTAIERSARALSGFFMQFVFNMPVIAVLGYAGWITAKAFIIGRYLPSEFFMHAFVTLGVILFLCFFLFQGCVRLFAGTDRITRKAFETVQKKIERGGTGARNPVAVQVEAVLGLGGMPLVKRSEERKDYN